MKNEIIVNKIITLLNDIDIDGETMEYILNKVGISDQILKQLLMKTSDLNLKNLLEEKTSFIKLEVAKKVWDDFCNNETLIYGIDDFPKYFEDKF
jgi:hypothetical protein